jgi:DNA-binding Lrp family transcriptional regulator
MPNLDQINIDILTQLEEDARISLNELSRRLGYPVSTIRDRIQKMEEDGIILGYHTVLDHKKLGYGIKAIVQIFYQQTIPHKKTLDEVGKFPEVTNIQFVTGEMDEQITVYARDVDHLREILFSKFGEISFPVRQNTIIVLHEQSFPFSRNFQKDEADTGSPLNG